MTKKSALHSNGKKLATQRICRPAPPTHGKQARAETTFADAKQTQTLKGGQSESQLKSDRSRARDFQSPSQVTDPKIVEYAAVPQQPKPKAQRQQR